MQENKAGMAILILNKIDLRTKSTTRDKEGVFHNKRTSKFRKQEIEREITL